MKIRSLEAVGFKSFVDRLHLSFPEGITTIVGPNGCGKSNFVDAILWAIGERSAKHLRGKLMEDVIFNGADGRKPLGMAEVSLTFSNEDGSAPIEYEAYSEITVTRRLYRSGESEYLINKTPCRLRDVTDLFLDTGIGVNGYSIVEQGRVERLINANPQDRRFLIEEAAGVARYKERKRLALMKMEATQQNLLRIQDIIAEVKRQIVTLERQVKRAEEYKVIRKEVREIELRFALHEYAELSEKGEAARGYLKALRDREMEISTQNVQKEAVVESNKLRAMEEEERLRILQQEIFEQGRKIQKAENDIEFFKREEGRFRKQEEEFVREVRESLGDWRASRQERKKLEQVRKGLEQEHRENEEIMREWETLFSDFRTTHQELLEELEDQKSKLVDTLTRMTSHQNRLVHLEERREDLQKRIRVNAEEFLEASRSLKQLEETASEKITEKERCLSLLASFQEEKIQLEVEIKAFREVSRQRQVERLNLEEMIRTDRSRYLSLKELQDNYEGYEKGVRSLLLQKKEEQEKWKGIMGAVADILEPDPRYEIPLEAVLGQRLQYLVVEGQKEGLEAIDFLKRESLGRGSFLPILPLGLREGLEEEVQEIGVENQIPSPPPSPLGGEGKGEGEEKKPVPLSRFVNVKEGFERIAQFLMEGIGVVENLEKALHWTKNGGTFRAVVTLEGEIFESSGVISGGSRDQGLGLLERRREIRELEQRVKEKEEECRKVREEEERLGQQITDREIQLEERKRGIQEKEIELLHRERDLEGLGKETSQSQQRMEVILFERKQLEEEQEDVDREKKEVSAQMELEETAKGEREEQVQSWKKKVEEVGEGGEELGARITEKKVVLASLDEKQKGLEAQIQNLSEAQRTLKEQTLKKVSGIRECRGEAASLREKILQTEGELEEDLKQHHLQEEMLSTQKEKVETLLSEWKEGEASLKYLRRELEDVRQKMHEQEILTSEVQLKLSHLQESMKEKYGATLSTSIGNSLGEMPKEEMSNRLAELKKAMEGFGEVNLMAIEEYQELKQRHDFLSEQQSDLHQALDSLKKAILRINRTTTKRFLETFHQVNERFKEVFLRLFRGGQASLILLGEEDPANMGIDILAQPPGKKLQNIDLLSGGEKALVATALLFGIFMIKPTPFCLLDEVDAPLDDANINRFIELVKEFSTSSQFIMITHNKNTMEAARTLYGITMETPGVSKVVSVRLN